MTNPSIAPPPPTGNSVFDRWMQQNWTRLVASLTVVDLTSNVSGILPVANGGIGVATASAATVFAGPTTGGAAAPGFRALVSTDIPSTYDSFVIAMAVAL